MRRILAPLAVSSFDNRPALSGHAFREHHLFYLKEITMAVGTVKFFDAQKGFGFIVPDEGGKDSFVHISAVERAGFATLRENQRLNYEVEMDKRGRASAVNLESVD